jgi:hypothetical protein
MLRLTPVGTGFHAGLLERTQPTRRLLVWGVTQEEYLAIVEVLGSLLERLEQREAAACGLVEALRAEMIALAERLADRHRRVHQARHLHPPARPAGSGDP